MEKVVFCCCSPIHTNYLQEKKSSAILKRANWIRTCHKGCTFILIQRWLLQSSSGLMVSWHILQKWAALLDFSLGILYYSSKGFYPTCFTALLKQCNDQCKAYAQLKSLGNTFTVYWSLGTILLTAFNIQFVNE